MDEDEVDNYLVDEDMLLEQEEYLVEEEGTELERVMTEEEYQDIESYRQAAEENDRYQERLNTNIERLQPIISTYSKQKRENPSRSEERRVGKEC